MNEKLEKHLSKCIRDIINDSEHYVDNSSLEMISFCATNCIKSKLRTIYALGFCDAMYEIVSQISKIYPSDDNVEIKLQVSTMCYDLINNAMKGFDNNG